MTSSKRIRALRLTLVVAAILALIVPRAASAQGTRDDYARAQRFLGANADGLVLNQQITPNWIGGTDRFWYRRELAERGEEFVLVDAARGTRGPAFDHGQLAQAVGQAMQRAVSPTAFPFDAFQLTEDGRQLSFTSDSVRWECDLSRYTCARGAAPPAALPGRSPDGQWQAFVRDHDLWIRRIESGAEIRLTQDGERERAWATPVTSPTIMVRDRTEQPAQNAAVFWAPDSRRLVSYRVDSRGAGTLSMVVHAPRDQIRPAHYTYNYPLPPDTVMPTAELFVFDVDARSRTAVRTAPITLQYYGGPSVTWSDDGRQFYVMVTDRGYTQRQLLAIDPVSGASRLLVDERNEPFLNTYANVAHRYVRDGREVLWASERDGWMHLYLYDGDAGRLVRQVTRGEWVVRGIVRVDETARVLYFLGGGREAGRDPYLQHLYRIGLDGTGLRLLTPEDAEHAVSFSPTGAYFVDNHSRADLAPVAVLRRAADGAQVMELERADISRLLATGWKYPEPFAAKARDGVTDVYGLIWRPTTLDPSRRYPIVETIYTGPQNFFTPKAFSAWRNHAQTIAELGFIVVQVDGLGTARRSWKFHAHTWKNLGDQGLPDHIAAIRQMAAKYPYMDLTRVGIFGHSAGGYDATHALLTHPEFYKVGVSSAGNHDHRLDKAVWNTQWMGWPIGPEYHEQSNVTLAANLQGKLLLAHGDVDENVPVSATLRLADALIAANKDFDLIIMTNRAHGFGSDPYFVRRRWDFFVKHLLGVDPPADFRITEQGSND